MRWAVMCVNAVHLSVAVGDWAYRHHNGLKFHVQNKTPEWDREDMMMRWVTLRY